VSDSLLLRWLARHVETQPEYWAALGNAETKQLRTQLSAIQLEKPIYICGLARAGTTIVTEAIAAHPEIATHAYRDFPMLFTPYWWNKIVQFGDRLQKKERKTERAHKDRLHVSPKSPEAFEEMLWMHFFDGLHDPILDNRLTREMQNSAFDTFYRDHIKKVLLVRNKSRYAAKENYHLTRLPYLHRLFPDARFIILVRHPIQHIASLEKQHRLFLKEHEASPKTLRHTNQTGHFEFGKNFRPVNVGDGVAEKVTQYFENGERIRGWACYWASLYGYIKDTLESDDKLATRCLILRYEDLCEDSERALATVLDHAHLTHEEIISKYAPQLSQPTYYQPDFTNDEYAMIERETQAVAERYSYTFTS
jgi:hypothetical protein